jgi:hypothetical protein
MVGFESRRDSPTCGRGRPRAPYSRCGVKAAFTQDGHHWPLVPKTDGLPVLRSFAQVVPSAGANPAPLFYRPVVWRAGSNILF